MGATRTHRIRRGHMAAVRQPSAARGRRDRPSRRSHPGGPNARMRRRASGSPGSAPSADLPVHLLEPLRTEWLLAHDRACWADDGWASAESVLWDENGTLVAYATQMMLFTYPPD